MITLLLLIATLVVANEACQEARPGGIQNQVGRQDHPYSGVDDDVLKDAHCQTACNDRIDCKYWMRQRNNCYTYSDGVIDLGSGWALAHYYGTNCDGYEVNGNGRCRNNLNDGDHLRGTYFVIWLDVNGQLDVCRDLCDTLTYCIAFDYDTNDASNCGIWGELLTSEDVSEAAARAGVSSTNPLQERTHLVTTTCPQYGGFYDSWNCHSKFGATCPPTQRFPDLTECQNQENSDKFVDHLEEIYCLCDEYLSDGGYQANDEGALSTRLVDRIKSLKQMDTSSASGTKFLNSWNFFVDKKLYFHENSNGTKTGKYFNRRMWRKVCKFAKVKRTKMRRWANKLDAINGN